MVRSRSASPGKVVCFAIMGRSPSSSWVGPFLLDQPKVSLVSNQDSVRHPQKQPGAHDAGNGTNVQFQPQRICVWFDLAVENVIAVVGHKESFPLPPPPPPRRSEGSHARNRSTTEFTEPP